jgi:hypothetical protein
METRQYRARLRRSVPKLKVPGWARAVLIAAVVGVIGNYATRGVDSLVSSSLIRDIAVSLIWTVVVVSVPWVALRVFQASDSPVRATERSLPLEAPSFEEVLQTVTGDTLVRVAASPSGTAGLHEPGRPFYEMVDLRLGEIALLRRIAIRPNGELLLHECEGIRRQESLIHDNRFFGSTGDPWSRLHRLTPEP